MTHMDRFEQNWEQAKNQKSQSGWEVVEHGWEQHVLVDHTSNLVYRYPRNQNAADKLADEVVILRSLHQEVFNVAIPFIVEHTDIYTVYRYIPGGVIDDLVLIELTDEEAISIGHDLGIFFARLHACDQKTVASKQRKQTMSLYGYYSKRIDQSKNSPHHAHASNLLANIIPHKDQVLVHGDLHGRNMVIDPINKHLVGVIDFSEVEIGDPHQDFRKIFMADKRFLDPSIESYQELSGRSLDRQQILLWAYVNEWANLAYFHDQPNHPTHLRALKHLMAWDEIEATL